jgi:hypothetical protein
MQEFNGLEIRKNDSSSVGFLVSNDDFEELYARKKSLEYDNVSVFSSGEAESDDVLSDILSKILKSYGLEEYVLRKVWLVKSEFETIDEGKLPFIPHIDKERYLKFMLYVTDVAEEDGPFYSCEEVKDVELYEALRQKIKGTKKEQKLNEINDFSIKTYKPVLGSSGDLVIFDTNIPHFAGAIEKGKVRKVIRFDFEKKEWNKKSFKSKFKSLFNP